MSRVETTTNFRDSDGVDLGKKLITKDYLLSVYPSIAQELGKTPELWTWGTGAGGALGNAAITNRSTPVTTSAGGTNWKQVSSGASHTAAIKTDGTLWTWGLGSNGRLGNAAITGNRSTPVTTFSGGTNWKQVACGNQHTAAIKTDGTLWTWGQGLSGRLGNGVTTGNRSTPVTTFAGGTNWKQVSGGSAHTAAIKTDGTLWTWGQGLNGQLGTAVTTSSISTPVTTFSGGTDWKQVSSGGNHTAAIKTDGTLWIWGTGYSGQLGTNDVTDRTTPVTTFAGGTNWKQVSGGSTHTAAIKTDGTLWTWGQGGNGQLGKFAFGTNKLTPITTFAGGTNWADTATTEPDELYTLSAGTSHTAAIKTDGTLWTWGGGSSGRLGNAVTTSVSTPVTTFAGGTNWKQVSSGEGHTAAIKTDGTLWTWGLGNNGRLGNAATTGDISTPVTTFAGGTNWKQVSSGGNHTAAIKTDGTLWTWGFGNNGRLGNGVTTGNISTPVTTFAGGTNWKQVSANSLHTAAIKTDGTLWTWGSGGSGVLGNGATTGNISTPVTTFAGGTNWKQVSSGNAHTAAIQSSDFI
jgi:alpha-tubulin suppressor-like RCC1 family protein